MMLILIIITFYEFYPIIFKSYCPFLEVPNLSLIQFLQNLSQNFHYINLCIFILLEHHFLSSKMQYLKFKIAMHKPIKI